MGPGSVISELADLENARKKADPSWPTMPSFDDIGLTLGADYNILTQRVNESPGERNATGGVLRFYGTWKPSKTDSGNEDRLVFKLEHRHSIASDIPPNVLLLEAGVAGVSGPTYSDNKTVLTNLYWGQYLFDNKFGYIAGIIDVSDYADVYSLANVWVDFNNLAFSTNPSMPVPSQGLGIAGRWLFQSKYYVLASIADINGDPHKPGDAFDSFFNVAEYFKHIEFGIIGSWEERASRNAHITIWQSDERKTAGIESDWGVAFSWSPYAGDWQPFLRGGYADKGTALLQKTLSTGVGRKLNSNGDAIGVGLNWGKAANNSEDQYISEIYYKWYPYRHVLLVPDAQFIVNPVNNEEDHLWLIGLKMRVTF